MTPTTAPRTTSSPSLIAGIDLGGTKLSVTLADRTGILACLRQPVSLEGDDEAPAKQAAAMIEQAAGGLDAGWQDIAAIGIASTGPFVRRGANLDSVSPNLCGGLAGNPLGLPNDWSHVPIQAYLRQRVARVEIQNDAVAALQAERMFGAARGSDHCAYATWSTGVGFGLCVDGRLLGGKHGNAGHAGHAFIARGDPSPCGCGNRGDAESMLAGSALARAWGRPPAEVFGRAARGDADALALVEPIVDGFAQLLHQLVVTLDLELIVLGGSVFANNQPLLLPWLRRALCAPPRAGLSALTGGVRLEPATLGDRVTDLGALALVIPPAWTDDGFSTGLPGPAGGR